LQCRKEFIRYVVVGVGTNAGGYLLYILFTSLGISPIVTISIGYPMQIGLSFFLNKTWSFSYKGHLSVTSVRYLVAYVVCYLSNVLVLAYFNSYLGYSHLVVQAFAIVGFALLLFLAQKYWVFRSRSVSMTGERTV